MKKFSIFFLMLAFGIASEAQPTYYNHAATTGGTVNIFPFNANPGPGKRVQFVVAAGEFNQPAPAPAGNNITALWFWANTAGTATYTNLTIRMATVPTSTFITTGAWYAGPMTTVLAQNTAVMPTGANTWVSIPLTTPFSYDPTMNIIIEVFHCGYTGAGFTLRQLGFGAAPNFRRQYSDAASACGATVLPTGGDLNLPGIGITTVSASCPPNTTANGTATINTAGVIVPISACNFAGDYSTINGAVNGQTLSFTSSVATDFITVRSGTPGGPVLASGTTPLTFANTFTGTIYAHWNTPGCGTQNTCRSTTVQCTNCGAPPCTVTLTSGPGTNSQNVCNGSAITPITYTTTVATGATFSGLPTGVTGNWAGNVATISGTPTINGIYNYTVTLVGCTNPTTATGTITVNTGGLPMSIVANPGTTLCAGDPALLTAMEGNLINANPAAPTAGGNGQALVTFNITNGNAFPATFSRITSRCLNTGAMNARIFYKLTPIAGAPGAISAANGWTQFGAGASTSTAGAVHTVLSGLTLVIPPGTTYGIALEGLTAANAANIAYTNGGALVTYTNGGCTITTGGNVGYGGVAAPGSPTFNPRNYNGTVTLTGGSLTPITTGTFLWSPATGLSSTTSNPTGASPMATTTYTVTHNNGVCARAASITLTIDQRPAVTAQPANTTVCNGASASFTVAGTGTGLTYQWQVSTTGAGGPWVNLANAAPYSGVTTAILTVNPVTLALSGNNYRAVLSGTCPAVGTNNISSAVVLTVNPLPTIAVTPTSGCGGVAGTNGLLLTASGASTYTWAPTTGLYTNATTTTPYTGGNTATVYAAPTAATKYVVTGTAAGTGCSNTASADVNYTPPAPTVVPSSVTMCLGDPAVKLKSSSSQQFTTSFTSGTVNITIPDGPTIPPVPTSYPAVVSNITVSGIPVGATIANVRARLNITHAWVSDLVIALKAPNGQVINLSALANFTNSAGANFTNTTFSSASNTAITPPYTGTYRADLAGATFNALGFTWPGGPTGYVPTSTVWSSLYSTPNGVWSVGLYDAGAPDGGVFNSWSLDIDYIIGVPATPAVWTPAAGLFSDAGATTAYVAGTEVDSVWVRPTPSGVYNYQATVKSLNPSGTIPLPAQTTTFTGNVRGYWFTAPSSFTMSSVFVPTDASTGNQSIAVIRFNPAVPPPAFPGTTNAFTTLFLTQNNPITTPIPVNIPINAGDVIGILGNRAGINSYGPTGPSTTVINGTNVTLTRMGMQFPLATTAPQAIWQEAAFQISRVFFSYGLPVPACISPARNITVTVNQPLTVTTQPVNQAICTDKIASFSVAVSGTGPYTYQWQVSTDGGNIYNNVANGGVYSGATSTTLIITTPPVSMNGYRYRCNITGAAPCAPVTSFFRILTVYPLPVIVINANPAKLLPGMRTTINSTVAPNAANPSGGYQWLRDGTAVTGTSAGIISGVGTGALTVDVDGQGTYQLRVTDVNGCTSLSNTIAITDSVSGKCFIYPNPNSGKFQVRYHSVLNNVLPRGISVFDAKGDRVLVQSYTIGRPYDRMDVDLRKFGKGLYWVEIVDANGNRMTMCRVVIQ